MAKKGNRVQVILECTEHKESGQPGTSRYITTKNKKNTPDRMELKKYNPILKKVTVHKEIKQQKHKVMAKKTVATLQKAGKNLTKVIKMVKSEKSGAYVFKEDIVPNEKVNDFFNKKQSHELCNFIPRLGGGFLQIGRAHV
eukprot:TRINITY_DN31037_c1_g1_i1.p1 TRINITY_DN31037_c1_g1~~TRINITY_DN31037_c1_g1_i1.p1  ORF type:complete len:164 (-),score=23.53 TRINITY_DN31037_c1_g1_i1:83-505(-)